MCLLTSSANRYSAEVRNDTESAVFVWRYDTTCTQQQIRNLGVSKIEIKIVCATFP